MNFELLCSGYLPVIIPVEKRLNYYEALDSAHTTSNYTAFIDLAAKLEKNALEKYLKIILE